MAKKGHGGEDFQVPGGYHPATGRQFYEQPPDAGGSELREWVVNTLSKSCGRPVDKFKDDTILTVEEVDYLMMAMMMRGGSGAMWSGCQEYRFGDLMERLEE